MIRNKFGQEINVGDAVVYTVKGGYSCSNRVGVVTEEGDRALAIQSLEKRRQSIDRSPDDVVKIDKKKLEGGYLDRIKLTAYA